MNANTPFDTPHTPVPLSQRTSGLKVLYVTANVLGGAGANAAEIFPRLAVQSSQVAQTTVADFDGNRERIKTQLGAEYLRLRPSTRSRPWSIAAAVRIARWTAKRKTDVIHVFYRQQSVPFLVYLGLFLRLLRSPARLIVDHRSVNLTRGHKARVKSAMNMLMQAFVHRLVGNPLAVETNHPWVFRQSGIIDLGYDELPAASATPATAAKRLWFIGSLKPRNRKSEFLVEVFRRLHAQLPADDPTEIHVAGQARPDQIRALQNNPRVLYHGEVDRRVLYDKLAALPGIGIAFMNQEYHGCAPSLKFVEYAALRFGIVASDTLGLRTQARRMGLSGVTFVPEDPDLWAVALGSALNSWRGQAPQWEAQDQWSYQSIFQRQVLPLYALLARD